MSASTTSQTATEPMGDGSTGERWQLPVAGVVMVALAAGLVALRRRRS
jgi:LPXTG-motif cell wall-anchored protein